MCAQDTFQGHIDFTKTFVLVFVVSQHLILGDCKKLKWIEVFEGAFSRLEAAKAEAIYLKLMHVHGHQARVMFR